MSRDSKENAKRVAKKVIEQIKRKELPNVGKAMREVGYSRETSEAKTALIKGNIGYIKEMEKFEDRLDRLILIGEDIVEKKQEKASFRDGVEAIDKLTKLKRLVSGQSTENVAHGIGALLDGLEEEKNEKDEGVERIS